MGLTSKALSGIAAALVVLVLAFCLSSVAHAAADLGCQGAEPCPRICNQSGTFDPIPVLVVDQVSPLHLGLASIRWLSLAPLPLLASHSHAGPSSPRAPPFFLA